MHSKILHWGGWVCSLIGLIDLPDQLQRWGKLILSAFGVAVNWEIDLLGNTGRWVFTIIGALMVLYSYDVHKILYQKFYRRDTSLSGLMYPRSTWREKVLGSTSLEEGRLMPLSEAAKKLYEAARQGRIPMAGAETLSGGTWPDIKSGSPEDILNWWAIKIADSNIPIYGRRPPANQLERIPISDRKTFIFKEGATILHHPADTYSYCDLSIKQKEFEEYYDIQAGFYER